MAFSLSHVICAKIKTVLVGLVPKSLTGQNRDVINYQRKDGEVVNNPRKRPKHPKHPSITKNKVYNHSANAIRHRQYARIGKL